MDHIQAQVSGIHDNQIELRKVLEEMNYSLTSLEQKVNRNNDSNCEDLNSFKNSKLSKRISVN